MIYKFDYTGPGKKPRTAEIRVGSDDPRSLGTLAEDAYQAKYNTFPGIDGYAAYVNEASTESSTELKPSILDLIAPAYSKKVEYDPKSDTVTFHGGSDDGVTEADSRAKEIISEAFEDIDRPDRYLQGEIDLIDAAYLLFPWDQFKGFMKITIMRYTLRYEHKGWLKDLDKITVYTRRLKELEVKNKEREERKNEK